MDDRNERLREKMKALFGEAGPLGFVRELAGDMPDAEWFLVGGMVRDTLLGRSGRVDHDLVVRGVTLRRLMARLATMGRVDLVGKSFGVLKFSPHGHDGEPVIDIAWPRTEQAGMSGAYRDFSVMTDPDLPIGKDLARRDYTVNALAWDVRREELIDLHGGLGDLEAGRLRAVGDPMLRFGEDLSRVLRGLRFACELGFEIDAATWEAMRRASPRITDKLPDGHTIVPGETVAKELLKAFAADPRRAAELFEKSGAFAAIAPEIMRMSGCRQGQPHHAEGDVWVHTKLALAALGSPEFASRFPGERASPRAVLGVLLHDVGKPDTAKERDGRMTFWGHDEVGARITGALARRLRLSSVSGFDVDEAGLAEIVRRHMFAHLVNLDEVKRTTLARYYLEDEDLGRDLLHVGFADTAASLKANGKPDFTHFDRLLAELADLKRAEASSHLLTGGDVMATLELTPGPRVGELLSALREEQLRGGVCTTEEAKDFLRRLVG